MSALYDQFGPMVRLAHLMTGSAAVAEDVVQDAFLRVAPHYAKADNPRAYLRTAVVNGCRSHERRAIRHERASTRAARPEPSYDARVVESSMDSARWTIDSAPSWCFATTSISVTTRSPS